MPFKKITFNRENIIITLFVLLLLFPYVARLKFPELNYHFRLASDFGKALILLIFVRNKDLGSGVRIFLGVVLLITTANIVREFVILVRPENLLKVFSPDMLLKIYPGFRKPTYAKAK